MTTRALLLENIHTDASARLAKEGYQVDTLARALGEDELIAAIDGVNLLGIRSGTQITERVLDAAPDLVAIGAFCIGVNQVDVAAASRRGVANAVGQYFWTRALHVAPATAVSPFFYLMLVWALVIGYIVWGDVPTPGLIVGSAIVVASGMLLLWHETARRRSERAIAERSESEDRRTVSART